MKKKETKWTCNYTLDKKLFKEFNHVYLSSESLILKVVLGIFVVTAIINLCLKNFQVITHSLVVLSFLILFTIIKKITVNQNFKRMLENHGHKIIKYEIEINENEIVIIDPDNNNKMTYNFSQIIGIIETPSLLVLKLKYNLGIIISVQDLKGSISELKEFLLKNCPLKKSKIIEREHKDYFLSAFTIIVLIILVISLIMSFNNDNYLKELKENLKEHGYNVELYSNTDSELIIYGINKNNLNFLLYDFPKNSDAKKSYNNWLKEESKSTNAKCETSSNYKKCLIETSEYNFLLIRNNNYILEGYYLINEKEEANELLKLINNLK